MTDPPRVALFGKLPGHGDFVRRGHPALVRRLDAWLTDGLERLVAADPDAGDRLASFPTWCFRLPDATAGALAPSADRVGRSFPIVACIAADLDRAEDVADAIATAVDADTVHAALLAMPAAGGGALGDMGWWRRDGVAATIPVGPDLPTGEAFAALIMGEA